MKIETKNVKFGDCNLIIGVSTTLLIDCGSKNSDKSKHLSCSEFAYSQIKSHITNNEIQNLIISHFDTDHFNGILEIPNNYNFENVFLPFPILKDLSNYTKTIAILLAVAPKNSWGFKLSKKTVELFLKLPQITKNIKFLKKGDTIDFDNKKIRVLWPDVNSSIYNHYPLNPEALYNFLYTADDINILEGIQTFEELFNNYLSNILDTTSSPSDYVTPKNLISAFDKLLQKADDFKNSTFYLKRKQKYTYLCRNQYHKLVNSMNALSLVCDFENHFLFLGDAPPQIIEHLKPCFNKKYNVVKIQHHATPQYYSKDTPLAEHYIISNGGYQNWVVDDKFLDFKAHFICTQKNELSKNCLKYNSCKTCSSKCTDCSKNIIC